MLGYLWVREAIGPSSFPITVIPPAPFTSGTVPESQRVPRLSNVTNGLATQQEESTKKGQEGVTGDLSTSGVPTMPSVFIDDVAGLSQMVPEPLGRLYRERRTLFGITHLQLCPPSSNLFCPDKTSPCILSKLPN